MMDKMVAVQVTSVSYVGRLDNNHSVRKIDIERMMTIALLILRSLLGDKALFPHILTKNQDFTVNFGQLPGPMFPLLKGCFFLDFERC